MKKNTRKQKLIRNGIVLCCLIGTGVLAAFKWETGLRALSYHTPLSYDEPFGPAIEESDRIVVRNNGFDCCGPVDETDIIFEITDKKEITDMAENIRFESRTTTNSLAESCMCCGGPGIDWYKGKKRLAFTAIQHGHAIRWSGFSTMRILGFRVGYGDGPLTKDSQAWLKDWFKLHGIGQEEQNKQPANKNIERTS